MYTSACFSLKTLVWVEYNFIIVYVYWYLLYKDYYNNLNISM